MGGKAHFDRLTRCTLVPKRASRKAGKWLLMLLYTVVLTGCWGGEATRISSEGAYANDDVKAPQANNTASDQTRYANQPFANGVMWKISRDGVTKAKIYGTLHIGNADELGLPNELFDTLQSVARLVLEVRPEEHISSTGELHRSLPGNGDLFQLLNPAKQSAFEAAAARYKVNASDLRKLRPWAALASLQSGRYLFNQSIDDTLHEKARGRGMTIIGLESLDEQLQAADCAPLESQLLLLNESLEHVEKFDEINTRMIALYRTRSIGELLDYATTSLPLSKEAQAVEDLDKLCLLSRRNQRMARRLERILPDGNALVAVGAFHLIGHDGVLCRLRHAGYEIEPAGDKESRPAPKHNACIEHEQ